MKKADFVDYITEQMGWPKVQAQRAFELIFDMVETELRQGNQVQIPGFGKFSLSRRKATQGRNPRTGEKISIAASTKVKFKTASALLDALNQAPKVGGQREGAESRALT